MRILVVEDDELLLKAVVSVLTEEGYQTDGAIDGEQGLFLAEQAIYDCIILDIMLPGMDGLRIVSRLRENNVAAPILLLTAKDSIEDRVRGLDTGADDYVTKPFAVAELAARVRALLRGRGAVALSGDLVFGKIRIDQKTKEVTACGEPFHLTVKEYEILEYLVVNKGQILTKEQIFDRVWGFDSDSGLGLVELYIHYLRKKLAEYGCEGYIQTVRSLGYMLKESTSS